MINIKLISSTNQWFEKELTGLLASIADPDEELMDTVSAILKDVRMNGDRALINYTRQFDFYDLDISAMEISPDIIRSACDEVDDSIIEALKRAAERIDDYHQHQKSNSWSYTDADGSVMGQKVTPLERAGVYVPGGKAAYPSTVLMNVIPAVVAGVEEIIMTVPAINGYLNPVVLAAAQVAGVSRIFSIGGAQAIAAMAYGTESVPAVDKIVGPGNRYVAAAKRLVYGTVGIDMIAGPSEVLIITDGSADPEWIAMDLFAQAEHDEDARAILISTDKELLKSVQAIADKLLPGMDRKEIIRAALENNGVFIQVNDLDEAISIANLVAPEHLELCVNDPGSLVEKVSHAGAIFMGHFSAEVLGDYCAGPNHVLPTGRTARFSSPLGVYDFQKRSSVIMCSEKSVAKIANDASVLAHCEGLDAHARSAELRVPGEKKAQR